MPSPGETKNRINRLIGYLVEKGLADAQNFSYMESVGNGISNISFQGSKHVSIALKDRSYSEIYEQMVDAQAYNVKMLDGALIQMMYRFSNEELKRHRLAFFPAPYLEEFQNSPEIYLMDEVYADVVARNIVPVPVRFDYGTSENDDVSMTHPLSHLTLGQYQNCRIPVSAPVTPFRFVEFILRNFYHRAFALHEQAIPTAGEAFALTIRPRERRLLHVVVPA